MPLLRVLRRILVTLRDHLDRWLHPRRQALARKRLGEIAPSSVLFVCLGNVCRSPYAERSMSARVDGQITIRSAGFIGPDRSPPDDALRAALHRGLDHSDHRSRTLTAEMLASADAVFVFDRYNRKRLSGMNGAAMNRVFWLGDFDPEWDGKRAILDPWGKSTEEFARIFQRIDRCVDGAMAVISSAP
ncbi:MAG: hypothetical protein OEZ65_16610 [Gemmatimonadota bacterium]|nr:hypothetical protein [Gemmatimonadota bacterium]